jgi:hypothetical protein
VPENSQARGQRSAGEGGGGDASLTVTRAKPTEPGESGSATLVAVTKNVPRVSFEAKSPVCVIVPPAPFCTAQVTR